MNTVKIAKFFVEKNPPKFRGFWTALSVSGNKVIPI